MMGKNAEKQQVARNFYRQHLLAKTFLAWKMYVRIKILKQLQVQQAAWFYNSLLLMKSFMCWSNVTNHQRHVMRQKNKLALWHWSLSLQRKVFCAWYTVVYYQRAVITLGSRHSHFAKRHIDERKRNLSLDVVPLMTTVTKKTKTLTSGDMVGNVIRRKTKPRRPEFLASSELVQNKQINNVNSSVKWLHSTDFTPGSFENFVPPRECAYPLYLSNLLRNNKLTKVDSNVVTMNFSEKLLTEDTSYHTVLNQLRNSSPTGFTAIPTKFCTLPCEYAKLGLGNERNHHGIEETDRPGMASDVLLCPADFSFGLYFLTSGLETIQNLEDLRETYSCSNVLLPPNAFIDNHCLADCTPSTFCRRPIYTPSAVIVNKKSEDFLKPPKEFLTWHL